MLILQPNDPRSWKAIETIVPQDLFLTVHFTLNKENVSEAKDILQKARQPGCGKYLPQRRREQPAG